MHKHDSKAAVKQLNGIISYCRPKNALFRSTKKELFTYETNS